MMPTKFPGFPQETFAFLEGIHAHNDKIWFDANRGLYEAGYVEPARAFVEAIGPKVGSSRVDLQACKLEYSIVSPK